MPASLHKRVEALERTALQHDKQIKAIRDLVREGVRLVIDTRKDLRKLAVAHIQLAEAQKRTEASLQAFIDSLRRGGNGHVTRKVDL